MIFFSPLNYESRKKFSTKIPTGIRVKIDKGWVLKIYPRSSFGFKYRMQLDNTVGIIDSDYYNAKNEGHIFIKISTLFNKPKNYINLLLILLHYATKDCVQILHLISKNKPTFF